MVVFFPTAVVCIAVVCVFVVCVAALRCKPMVCLKVWKPSMHDKSILLIRNHVLYKAEESIGAVCAGAVCAPKVYKIAET